MRHVMTKFFRAAIFIAFIFSAKGAFATCHAVGPSGSGSRSGADWNNAMAGLPATLARGDIYYLADGNYSSGGFSTPNSGTTITEVRKAQSYDTGSSCSPSIAAGWNTGTMGSSQAVFTSGFGVATSYFILNGNGTSTVQGCGGAPGNTVTASPPNPSDCGIKIDNSGCSGGANACNAPIFLGDGSAGTSNTGFTFKYIELKSNGNNASEEMEVWAPYNRGVSGTGGTFTHVYFHNAGCVYFQNGGDGRHVSYSYFWGTEVNGAPGGTCHGQYAFYDLTDSNGTEDHNVYRDITGTAVFTFASGGGTHTGWKYYDNVFIDSTPGIQLGNLSDGIIACINTGSNCNGFVFNQNTMIQLSSGSTGINNENTGSYTIENNIWYLGANINFNTGTGGSFTQSNNSFLASGSSCPTGSANVCANSSPNPFTNWAGGVFTLASENNSWANHMSLSAPYNMDAAGNVFTTDRGAYQYNGVTATQPQPPTNLLATAQ